MNYIITGPTGSGKTELAEYIAEAKNLSIVSADSMAVYRYADIGTAKPKSEKIRYELIDIREPDEEYTAYDFMADARKIIAETGGKKKSLVICGGTAHYIDALINGLPQISAITPEIKAGVEKVYKQDGTEGLCRILKEKDPEIFEKIDKKNPRRLIRALEVIRETGRKFSELRKKREMLQAPYRLICLFPRKAALAGRIRKRTEGMISAGLFDETLMLKNKYGEKIRILSGIGYKEMLEHIRGIITIDECRELIVRNTLKYIKRQMTYFKKMEKIETINIEEYNDFPVDAALEIIGRG